MNALVRQCPNCVTARAIHPCYPGCADGVLTEPAEAPPSNVIRFPARKVEQPPTAEPVEPPAVELDDHGAAMLLLALDYADAGWEVFPLGTQMRPRIPRAHPKHVRCKGECGKDGHGVNDATTDPATVCRWWATEYLGCNIGLCLPPALFVLDADPRKPDHVAALELLAGHGPLPHTLITYSGKRDGGLHRFYRKPSGEMSGKLTCGWTRA
jgi:hypothetical protein